MFTINGRNFIVAIRYVTVFPSWIVFPVWKWYSHCKLGFRRYLILAFHLCDRSVADWKVFPDGSLLTSCLRPDSLPELVFLCSCEIGFVHEYRNPLLPENFYYDLNTVFHLLNAVFQTESRSVPPWFQEWIALSTTGKPQFIRENFPLEHEKALQAPEIVLARRFSGVVWTFSVIDFR